MVIIMARACGVEPRNEASSVLLVNSSNNNNIAHAEKLVDISGSRMKTDLSYVSTK
jgi:hypothetical protein